ncbi:hypothetical protein APUTEX25_001075, partial [Auxenochlorella protothecoides]
NAVVVVVAFLSIGIYTVFRLGARQDRNEVGGLLLDDPHNDEYKGIYESLTEVIQLTKELVAEGGPSPSQPPAQPQAPTAAAPLIHPAAAITTAPDLRLPSILPPTVAAQIRSARHRAAFAGQAPAAWAIGAPVQAIYREDGQWYNGVVSAVSVSGKFIVQYEGYDQAEEVEREEVRLRGAEANGGYTGVVAPKKRKVNEEVALEEMPAWLQIKPEDDEKVKAKKKKLQKSYKSKQRFARMDVQTKEKANSWKNFVSGKGSKKKPGFMTGHKKESIFKVPDGLGARVGVVGSGKPMTEFGHARRHDFAADA